MSGYIGTQPVPQATQTRDSFTATSGQTSFSTSGYTPNFLDVYLNGVKLAAADYTASNGSDVVLASGAATGDILEVVAFTTFNSASSSIDDNGNATAITIDSSENVNIGGSPASDKLSVNGTVSVNDSTYSVYSSGVSSNIGSVGNTANDLNIFSTTTGHNGLRFHSVGILPTDNTGAIVDNDCDLGISSHRFKDAYLSGGVYLGGTGAANKLDDYEEGTWTPNYEGSSTAGSVTYTARGGTYTKIGNQVTVYFSLLNFSVIGASGGVNFTGLPFQALFSNNVRGAYSGNVRMYNVDIDNDRPYVTIQVDTGSSTINFIQWVDNGPWIAQPVENGSGQYIEGYLTYTTAS